MTISPSPTNSVLLSWLRLLLGVSLRRSFRGYQFVEPFDFALTGLQPELMQLPGVAVDRAAGPRYCFTQALTAFLHLTTAALQDPHPGLGRSAVEECEVNTESVVGVILRTGVGHQFGEALLTRVGELVDATSAPHLRDSLWCRVLDDQAVGLHASQRRVERAVRERAKRPEQTCQPFAQFIAVHR